MSRLKDLIASSNAVPTQNDAEFADYNEWEQRLLVKCGGDKGKLLKLYRRVKGRWAFFSVAGTAADVVEGVACTAGATGEVLESDLLRANGEYGQSIKILGNEMFVGEPGALGSIFVVGEMHYYTRASENDTWVRQSGFHSPTQSNGSGFGQSVSYDGSRVVVGEPNVSQQANVFTFSGGSESIEQEISANTYTDGSARFSRAVAINGSNLLIGAPGQDITEVDQGGVEYWTESGGTWTFQQAFTVNGTPAVGMGFGQGIAMVDDATAYISYTNASGIGVQKWTRSGTTWSYDSEWVLTDYTNAGTNYAMLDTDGTNLIIGQGGFDAGPSTNEGVVVVTDQSGTVLVEILGDPGDFLGTGVSLNGQEAAIGFAFNDPSATSNAGEVYMWTVCP